MYIISKCLLGENCKYNGGNNYTEWVADFCRNHSYFPVCPETEGGLKIPRPPAEIQGEFVKNIEGLDVTEAFRRGADRAWNNAVDEACKRGENIEGAILKAKSPSCGSGIIYDGTFTGTVTEGDGYLTKILKQNEINVISEKERI